MTDPSFESLVRPEVERLYRLACRLTDTRADAEDLVQDVLVRAFVRRNELTSIEALGPWLARVLYNRFIDERRRLERQRLRIAAGGESEDADRHEQRSVENEAERAFDIRALQAALAELSLEQRAVLLMHDSEGYKLSEIQAITGAELGTLKSRLHRARARMRETLANRGTF